MRVREGRISPPIGGKPYKGHFFPPDVDPPTHFENHWTWWMLPTCWDTVLTKRKFPPRNRQNNFFLSMWGKLYLHQCIENSNRDRLVQKNLGFFSFWGNSGPVSDRKLTFCEHCTCHHFLPNKSGISSMKLSKYNITDIPYASNDASPSYKYSIV